MKLTNFEYCWLSVLIWICNTIKLFIVVKLTQQYNQSQLVTWRVGDMTRDVTRYLFLAQRDMTRHITGDVTRYSF